MYKSPTDMGVNRISSGIIDDEILKNAATDEIIRRYFRTLCDYKKGVADNDSLLRAKSIMQELNLNETDRQSVLPARQKSQKTQTNCVALQLNDGRIVTGKMTNIMEASASCIINAIKLLANLDDNIHLISPSVLNPIFELKEKNYQQKTLY